MRLTGRVFAVLTLGATTMLVMRPVAAQLYSETFVGADLAAVGWNNTSAALNAAGLFDHSGNDVSNEAATPDGIDTGAVFHFMNLNNAQAIWTTEFNPINPTVGGGVDIVWWQTEDAVSVASTIGVHVAVQVGGQWYASDRAFSTTDNQDPWQRHLLAYDPAAANWRSLTLNTEFVTLGAAPGASLSGNITGLGLVSVMEFVGAGVETVWYDYIEITSHLIPGDVNGVGGVTVDDYIIIKNNYLTNVNSRALGDLNDDGIVNVIDFREWKNNFSGPLAGIQALPEPTGAVLALLGLVGWSTMWARRRFESSLRH